MLWNPNRKKLFAICFFVVMAQSFCFSAPTNNSDRLENDVKQNTKDIKFNEGDIKKNIRNIDKNDGVIIENKDAIKATNKGLGDVAHRVSELEETQFHIDAEIQIYDSRDWKFSVFLNTDVRHNRVDAVGVKITYKIGKDHAVKRMDELERKIDTYIKLKEQENIIVVQTENGFAINTKF